MGSPYVLVFIALAIIVLILAVYLGFLASELSKQKRKRLALQQELDDRRRKRDEGIYESLRIISLAVIQDQCEISEASIRIYKLMSILEDFQIKEEYHVFTQIYEKLKEFDFLEKRQELTNQERFDQDKERFAIEDDFRDKIVASCKVLNEHMNVLT